MGHIQKSKARKQAHPLKLSLVMGRNDNMVGGAGAAADTRYNPFIPKNSMTWSWDQFPAH